MAGNFKPSSFIPKKTLSTSPIKGETVRKSVNVFLFVSGVIFIISILSAGGMFLYERYVISKVKNQKISLDRARDAFEPKLISELARLDTRLTVANSLLNSHITASPFFNLLGTLTLKAIRFEKFDFARQDQGLLGVIMTGVADNYTAIALQSDLFGNNEYIKDPVFSDFNLRPDGTVEFNVGLSINEDLLLYANSYE